MSKMSNINIGFQYNCTQKNDVSNLNTNTSETYINSIHNINPSQTTSTELDYDEILLGTFLEDSIKLFGITHYKYSDCKKEDLVSVSGMQMHKDCATAFSKMQKAAKEDGINIYPVSTYRSSEYQKTVFKKKFIDKNNPTSEEMRSRLRFSAPSGFSEHHTGYAVDINSTSQSFENTKAYKWLEEHASEYGFEISFPKNNHQNLGFEPWHWRFVGTEEAQKIFEQARTQK